MEYTNPSEVEMWLEELNLLAGKRQCAAPRFIKPFHLAMLAHKMRQKKVQKLGLPEKLAPYANTMKLWESLGMSGLI
jgi:hypothetical protein